jgi:hypothetical protein
MKLRKSAEGGSKSQAKMIVTLVWQCHEEQAKKSVEGSSKAMSQHQPMEPYPFLCLSVLSAL